MLTLKNCVSGQQKAQAIQFDSSLYRCGSVFFAGPFLTDGARRVLKLLKVLHDKIFNVPGEKKIAATICNRESFSYLLADAEMIDKLSANPKINLQLTLYEASEEKQAAIEVWLLRFLENMTVKNDNQVKLLCKLLFFFGIDIAKFPEHIKEVVPAPQVPQGLDISLQTLEVGGSGAFLPVFEEDLQSEVLQVRSTVSEGNLQHELESELDILSQVAAAIVPSPLAVPLLEPDPQSFRGMRQMPMSKLKAFTSWFIVSQPLVPSLLHSMPQHEPTEVFPPDLSSHCQFSDRESAILFYKLQEPSFSLSTEQNSSPCPRSASSLFPPLTTEPSQGVPRLHSACDFEAGAAGAPPAKRMRK